MKTNRGLIPGEDPVHRRKGSRWLHLLFLPLLLCAGLWFLSLLPPSKFYRSPHLGSLRPHDISAHCAWCNLTDVSSPPKDGLKPSDHFMEPAHVKLQVERLSRAVRIGTESYDDNGDVEEDPRWQVFDTFHQELEELFPFVHSTLQLRKVNKYGLLYILEGSDPSLKPALFMAHQDVVPADANSSWTHPPYSGYYDGSFIWGRGSADCKNVLVGLLSVMEDLIEQAFAPQRTIVLAFGFDEETGGVRGAATLSQALIDEWGPGSFIFALDEGGMGLQELGDILYAYPGVGEKGYLDVQLALNVTGGHSSRPPRHTSIGIMADMILALESNPYTPRLTQQNPFRRVLECQVKHSPDEVYPWLRDALLNPDEEHIAEKIAKESSDDRWLMQTSQAVDVIAGGLKVNALPEEVTALVNYRVALHQTISFVIEHIRKILTPIARKHNIDLANSKDSDISATNGHLAIGAVQVLEPSPISPTDNSVWALFSGTLRSVFESTETGEDKTVVPVGSIMTGNTDTTHYWNVTKNIYRYTPAREGTRLNAHAVDERMDMTAHLEGMRFYYDLIRNFDKWDEK